jgi:hypothetical protein
MRRRIMACAVGAALAVGFGGPVLADHDENGCNPGSSGSEDSAIYEHNPATEGYVYADGDGDFGGGEGYVGVVSSDGTSYLELSGESDGSQGGSTITVHGEHQGQGLDGEFGVVDGDPYACPDPTVQPQ